jgi:hypothetical protein
MNIESGLCKASQTAVWKLGGISELGQKRKFSPRANVVRFSNRPVRVKRFQTIHHDNVDVARCLALLFGIGTRALPAWVRRRGGTIYSAALPSD